MKFLSIKRLALIILLAFSLFSASTNISSIEAQEMRLRVMVWSWSSEVDEALEGTLARFRESRNVNIELIRVPPEIYWDELLARLRSEEPPDLLWVHDDMVPPLVERGQIIQLDPYIPERPEAIQGIPDEVLERFRFEGRLYGIPLGPEGEFVLNAYAVSTMALEFGKVDLAFELIVFLRSSIPPSRISPLPPGELPDFVVAELNFSPERPQPGDELTIDAVIQNIGDAPAEEVLVLFMIDRRAIATETIRYLGPGAGEVVTTTWIATTSGDHTLFIEIDPEGWIRESNEENNIVEEIITVRRAVEELPDLVVTGEDIIISPAAPYVGDEVTIEATIRNRGNAPADGVSVVLRSHGWEQWASIEYIEAGGEEVVRIVELASSPSEYLVTVIVDPENRIEEWDEENNQASRSILVREEELPDLTVTAVRFTPEAPHAGQPVVIGAVVRNQGDWDAGDFFVSFFVDDQRIGSRIINRLSPGEEEGIRVSTAALAAGGHSVKVIADPDGWVRESDETNNEGSTSLTVREAEFPDLIIEDLTVNPESPAPGEEVTISLTILNRGRGRAEWVDVALSIIDMEKARQTECPPDVSYADEVVEFVPGAGANPHFGDPAVALGPPDLTVEPPQGFVNLGIGGSITLAFVDNLVIDEPGYDLRIWGKPDQDESFYVEASEDGHRFESFGLIRGMADLDLADVGLESARLVRIRDDGSREQEGTASPGAELDAVEALHCRSQVDWLELDYLEVFAYLELGQREVVTATWTATSVGDHALVAEIDPLDSVRESDETNNKIEEPIRVKEE